MTEPTDVDHDVVVASRRRFLREGGALMGGAVLAGGLAGSEALAAADAASASNVPPNVPEWMKAPGDPVGSQLYGPYAPTLFDYIRRAMPQSAPQSLDNNEVYAVSAYILNLNGLLPADATLDAKTLGAIKMPNRSMFVDDPRPDVKNPACMTGC